ncbi:MAG: DUF2726 domain-containing protein [Lentisphaerae bacterium]|jgi:very-short-patch-repair endonuclease|nr:DUF2726 domain-containing protein [Lentisphaerota bacterium]MBT4817674.1 DUF2726 domain-containing protein [Lentisphaerota bacterium]MBT5612051.1 DUF2726 domain-containing protein [Lentisphaerota bacterium]MBT7056907.1 DUF2726 domain-containing protein [Lentisphaerota bacterium]MBT7842042.1 DUF2726 domain-containing protein [Lentisphaerota bacterium]
MSDPTVVAIVLVIVVGLVLKAPGLLERFLEGKKGADLPYVKAPALVTAAERSFLGVLDSVLDGDERVRVLSKVRLGDIIHVRKGLDRSDRQSYQNKIDRKHVDFVLCRADDLGIIGVIELDDSSHRSARRRDRDEFVDCALASAGVQIRHIPAQRTYNTGEVARVFSELLSPEGGMEQQRRTT